LFMEIIQKGKKGLPRFVLFATLLALVPPRARAEPVTSEIEALKREIRELQSLEAETRKRLEELQRRIDRIHTDATTAAGAKESPENALDAAVEALSGQPKSKESGEHRELLSQVVGGTKLRLIDISFNVLAAAGTSTASSDEVRNLQGGGHDPHR